MVRVDFPRLITNAGVAAVLLGGIGICVAQGYKGFLALQDATSPPTREALNTRLPEELPDPGQSLDTAAVDEPASYRPSQQPAADTVVPIKASVAPLREPGARRLVQPAVWRSQRPLSMPQAGPRGQYGNSPAVSGWPRTQPPVAAPWQPPAYVPPSYTPRGFVRPSAVRSGFGPSVGPRSGGKSCMGFG